MFWTSSPHGHTHKHKICLFLESGGLHQGSGSQDTWKALDLCSKEKGVGFDMGRRRG